MGFQEDMNLLLHQLRELEREYEQWFAGVLKKPPWERRRAVERIIRKYNVSPPRTVAEQSVFQMHQAKFNTYSEMWNRRTRLKEEGRLPTGQVAPGQRVSPSPPPARGPSRGEDYRQVFDKYVAAKRKAGEATSNLSYESFSKALRKQADQLRSRRGFQDVDFGVSVKDGKISVVARKKK